MRNLLWGIRPPILSFLDPTIDLSLDRRVLAFNLAVSLATGLLCGLIPALQASRRQLIDRLRQDTVGSGSSQAGTRARQLLVVTQIALSLAALVGGLFVRSLRNFESVRPGFETQNLLQLTIGLEGQNYSEGQVRNYQRRVVESVAALPGVVSASLANSRLMSAAGVIMHDVIEVVGLVRDARLGTVTNDPEPMIYTSLRQRFSPARHPRAAGGRAALGLAVG